MRATLCLVTWSRKRVYGTVVGATDGGKSSRAMMKFRTRMRRNQVSVRRGGIGARGGGVAPPGVPWPDARGAVVTFRLEGGCTVRSGEVIELSLPKTTSPDA